MFYGTITKNGTIDDSCAFSNNFSVQPRGTGGSDAGKYIITFNEYFANAPTIVVTANSNGTGGGAVSVECWRQSSNEVLITTTELSAGDSYNEHSFSFHARTGMTKIFTAQNLTLTPKVVDFNGNKVLTLSTIIGGEAVALDKGTVLIGVGTKMTLALDQSSVSDNSGNTWSLSGWTYGGGSGASGAPWSGGGTPSFSLTTDPEGAGPATTPYTFAIKGILSRGSGPTYISSDPVIRLSSVPPAGLSL